MGRPGKFKAHSQREVLIGTRSANFIRASGHMRRLEGPDI